MFKKRIKSYPTIHFLASQCVSGLSSIQLGRYEHRPRTIWHQETRAISDPLGIEGSTRRLDGRRVSSSRGLTRITPLTVPNPPSRILVYASVVSAFFTTRYRLDKLPRQLVSQSVARLVELVPSRRATVRPPCGTFHPPMRASRLIAGLTRPHRAACKQREKKTRGRVASVYVRADAIMVSGAGYSDIQKKIRRSSSEIVLFEEYEKRWNDRDR